MAAPATDALHNCAFEQHPNDRNCETRKQAPSFDGAERDD